VVEDYPTQSKVKPLLTEFLQRLNAGKQFADASMTCRTFSSASTFRISRKSARPQERDTKRSGGITSEIASATFACGSSELCTQARCSRQLRMTVI
jgi:hypothetical protein